MAENAVNNAGTVIIGSGHSGGRCAERLRAFGYAPPVTVVGQEPHMPYERPPLSKGVLQGETAQPPYLLSAQDWAKRQITLRSKITCEGIDVAHSVVLLSDGTSLAYDNLVLATGLQPRRSDQFADVSDHVFVLHNFDDAKALRAQIGPGRRLAMIGGGFIGLEVAASARKSGAEVSVIEMASRPLSRVFDRAMSEWFVGLHRDNGTDVICGATVATVKEKGKEVALTLRDGKVLTVDAVVLGLGGVPRIELAQNAGIEVSNGVEVDEHCRTSAPNIYAIGDIANMRDPRTDNRHRLESWKYAEYTAATAARAIAGAPDGYDFVPWFWTDQFDHNIQIIGNLLETAQVYQRGTLGSPQFLAYHVKGETLISAVGIDCGRDIRKARGTMEKNRPVSPLMLAKLGLEPVSATSASRSEAAS